MANVTVYYLLGIVNGILLDDSTTEADRGWAMEDLVEYYNLVARQLVSLDPKANPVTAVVALAAGTKQSIPSGGIAFLKGISNMGVGGVTPGTALITSLPSLVANYDLDWRGSTEQEEVYNVMPDPEDPTTFYNYPAADGTGNIQLQYSAPPATVTWDAAGVWQSAFVGVKENYVDAVMYGILEMAYQKDSDFPGSADRAVYYKNLKDEALGIRPQQAQGA